MKGKPLSVRKYSLSRSVVANLVPTVLIAVIHFVAYLGLWGTAFGIGDGGGKPPAWLDESLTVLGFPLLPHIFGILPTAALNALNGMCMLYAAAALNGLIWGAAITALVRVAVHAVRSSTAAR